MGRGIQRLPEAKGEKMRIIDLFPEALDREEDLLLAEFDYDPGCNCPDCKQQGEQAND